MRLTGALLALAGLLAAGCQAAQDDTLAELLDGGIAAVGCPDFLYYDAGAIGSAGHVVGVASAAAQAWLPGLSMTGLSGKVSPNGTDVDGGWTFTFGGPGGTATVTPFATHSLVVGSCAVASTAPSIRDFTVDSTAAFAIALDAGCRLGAIVPVTLLGSANAASPLAGIDSAWLIDGKTADGGALACVVNARTGAYGIPDAGPPDGG